MLELFRQPRIKNDHFLTTDHRNIERENFFRDFRDVTLAKSLFKSIRAIYGTDSRSIWARTCEDIDHIATPSPPKKKKSPYANFK